MSTTTSGVVDADARSGLKLLSLDAGGAYGVSQLQILNHVIDRLSHDTQSSSQEVVKRPCEIFDAIGGTGTGGLIAIFLVVLKMTAKEAIKEFAKFAIAVYKDTDQNPRKQTEKLRRAIYDVLERHGTDKDMNLIMESEPMPSCRLIIPIMYKNNVGVTCVLKNHVIRQEPPTNLTIAEAMLATSATTPLFTPISIGKDFSTFEYVSGDLGLSNPVREIIAGAHHTFGDEATVACLLSIGCGRVGNKSIPSTSDTSAQIDFLKRLAMDSEKAAEEIATQMRRLTLYHRFSVNYGPDAVQSGAWHEPETIAAHTTVYLNDLEVGKVVDSCVDAVKTGYGSATLEQLRHSGGAMISPPPLPPLTPNYVERKEPMDFVEKALFEQDGKIKLGSKRIVVTGIGGCGKTQLVRKLVENHRGRFVSTFIVDGSSRDSLRRDVVRHVRSLNAAHSQDSFEESMAFLSQPIRDEQRLLIIDNVDDPSLDLAPFLPRWIDGIVIVTSRNASRGQISPSAHLQLDVMSLEESVELLERGSGREWPPLERAKEAAAEVAKELGCHPIALVQAISYMSSTGYTAETYISRLRRYRKQLLDDPATNQVDMRYLTAFAAFDASYDTLPSTAQRTLHLLSFFHRQKFPLDLVTLAAEEEFSIDNYNYIPHGKEFEAGRGYLKGTFCSSGEWSPRELDSIIMSLRNQSLISVVLAPDVTLLVMHSLAHEWSRLRIPGGILEDVQAAAIRLLCCGARKEDFLLRQYLFNHIQVLSLVWDHLHANDAASFGFILRESGMYANAARVEERVCGMLKIQLGMDHPDTISASADLAVTYSRLGRYLDAEVLLVDVLRGRNQLLGRDHPDTISASASLALTYKELGRYADAEVLLVDVLRRRNQLLGRDHPDTISASANLALNYIELGRYADAEVLLVDVLRRLTQLLGTSHPDTISASENLALTWNKLGRYADADVLLVDVLRRRNQLLGRDHPDTISASANLALTYNELGRYADAEALLVDVLKQLTQLLGTSHPDTISASENFAITCGRLGRYTDAEVLLVDVLRRRNQLLGRDHPDTISSSANLAIIYKRLGRCTDAAVLELEVLRRRNQLLGMDHPDTIKTSANLAATHRQLGRYSEAEVLEVDVLRRLTQLLGTSHPYTIMASANLALTYNQLGRHEDAEVLEVEVLRRREQLIGMDHPDTIMASANLAVTYTELGRHVDAEVLEVDVLRRRKQLLGMDHPETISASANLALTWNELGRCADAEALQVTVLRQQKQLLGMDHPETINASANLAVTYHQLERYADAEVLQVDVLRQLKRLMGMDHPDTILASANLALTYSQLTRYADAEALQVDVLRQRKEMLGTDHPDTIVASANLASTYHQLGRYADAEVLQVDVLRQLKQLLGTDHPDTTEASENLALTWDKLGRSANAEV